MPKKKTFTSRFEETRGGRVPQKSKIWGDVFYGWSLTGITKPHTFSVSRSLCTYVSTLFAQMLKITYLIKLSIYQ